MNDYRAILRQRISEIPKDMRFVSDYFEDCLGVFQDVLCELIREVQESKLHPPTPPQSPEASWTKDSTE